jgi:gluconate 2-dehydrogenase alpha chain
VGFGCANYSKASPQTSVLPALMRKSNFEARTECEVLKINLDRSRKRATGVTYIDSSGAEWEQPAELVLICAFAFNNVHMMLISGIGRPYDPKHAQGNGRAQLRLPDLLFHPALFPRQDLQSVHWVGRARADRG